MIGMLAILLLTLLPLAHRTFWTTTDYGPWLHKAVTTTQHTAYNETLPKCVVHGKWYSFNLPCKADTPDWFGPDSTDASSWNDMFAMLDST